MTKMDPVDVVVIYPGERSDRYLSGAMFIRLEAADLALKEDGVIILALSAAGGWAAPEAVAREQAEPPATMRLSLEEMARAMARKQGNLRNVSICYTAKRVLGKYRSILVCDGIGPEEARGYGFVRDDNFDTAPYAGRFVNGEPEFLPEPPQFNQLRFGGYFGGPVKKDAAFFFVGYEDFDNDATTVLADFLIQSAALLLPPPR